MSNANEDNQPHRGGYSLSGSGPAESLPAEWARSTARGVRGQSAGTGGGNGFSSSTRIGRIGGISGLGGGSGNSSSAPRSGGRFATLRDIAGSAAPPVAPSPGGFGGMAAQGGEDEDDEAPEGDENDAAENWYAGGERSGISIENPDRRSGNNVVRDILRKAAEAGAAPQPPAVPSGPFSGPAYTLGSDEVDSSYIPDPSAPQGNAFIPPTGNFGSSTNHVHPSVPGDSPEDQDVATRHITFWRDGFSVEDGSLMRYDEPANSQLLDEINTGHAPPQILNVRIGQPVELRVTRRLNEDYIPPPKRPVGTFEGQGYRLGAVVPDVIGTLSSPSSLAGAFDPPGMSPMFPFAPYSMVMASVIPGALPMGSSTRSVEASNLQTQFEVDQSLPTTSVQVRLVDGTRMVARMNLHHTVGDIRSFINASWPGSSTTPYTIQTTFPNRILEDDAQTIEHAGLKNSVIVQKLV